MSLTGSGFFFLAVALAVLAFAGAVLMQPRLAGSGARALAARITSMLVVNLLVVFAVLVGANDRFAFFANWQDVRGALIGAVQPNASYSVGGPETVGAPARPVTEATTQRIRQYSVSGSGLTGEVMVTLPQGYFDQANRHRRYPVLETFHGYPGTPAQWNHSMAIRAALDTAAARHQIADVITLSPTWEFPRGIDTECVDGGRRGPNVEGWLTRDVPSWATRRLRVQPGRGSWATIGLSAGGWCAAMATMLHPNQYAAAIVLGGYFAPDFSRDYRPFSSNGKPRRRYDLVALARTDPPPVALWVQTSEADPLSYPSTSRLLAATRAPMTVHALVLKHAGHRLSIWAGAIPAALSWLGQLSGFAPA